MSLLDYFRTKVKSAAGAPASANLAKERLQIIVAHERTNRNQPDYLPDLQRDIMEVISRYISINKDQVNVNFDRSNQDCSILELNISLPDSPTRVAPALFSGN